MTSEASAPDLLELMLLDTSVEPRNLPMSLLKYITNNFSDDQQIGSGGFAVVYKGILQNGAVAVKRLSTTLDVDDAKFYQEVDSMLRVKHKNIVRFLGYCSDTQGIVENFEGKNVMAEDRKRFLCFEFVPLGSLDNFISDASGGLEWRTRYQIIKGICEGLHYLHQQRIVHLDLKPANILLDYCMIAKIADFGLSKCFDEKQTRAITLNVFGSLGYMAPEFHGGLITFKSDIYSLGVIILEILTGRKGYPEIDNVLESWGKRFGTLLGDTRLEQVRICTELGIECTDFNPAKRPDTRRILERLDGMEHAYGIIVSDLCTSSETEANSSSMLPSVDNEEESADVSAVPSPLHLVTIEPKGHGETGDEIRYHPGPSKYGELLDVYPLELHLHFVPNKMIDCPWTLSNRTDDIVAVWITPIYKQEPCLHLWHPVPSLHSHVALDDDPCRSCFEIIEPHCTRVVAMRMEKQGRKNYGRSMFELVMIIDPPSKDQLKSAVGRKLNLDVTLLKQLNELGSGHVHRALLTAIVCDPASCQQSHYSSPGPDDDGVGSVVPRDLFERLLLHRNDAGCPARGFYTYDAFLAAATAFPAFGATGSSEQRKREVAAFLGQTSHETTGGWQTAPDGPFSWGYCFKQELNPPSDYCEPSSQQWPGVPGKKYFGRGPIQLRYNFNYGPAGQAIGVDLLNNPDLVATDAVVSFKTALWFWMTPQGNMPSCHAVITGQWTPTDADRAAGRVPGYGVITNLIGGGAECGRGPDPRAADRLGFYKRYCDMFGISYGSNLDCGSQRPFNAG